MSSAVVNFLIKRMRCSSGLEKCAHAGMKMEIRVSICVCNLGTLRRLSYKGSMSTARLEIPFFFLFRISLNCHATVGGLGLCDFIRA